MGYLEETRCNNELQDLLRNRSVGRLHCQRQLCSCFPVAMPVGHPPMGHPPMDLSGHARSSDQWDVADTDKRDL